jgi:hypothetical protein
MRLIGALDAVLSVVAFGGKELRDLVDAARSTAAIRPGGVKDGLTDLEPVIAQVILRAAEKTRIPPPRRGRALLSLWDSY